MATIRFYCLLPYLRTIDGVKIGGFQFKAFDDFKNEEKTAKNDVGRIIGFFRQREGRTIDAFNYLVVDLPENELDGFLSNLRRSLEIFRYLTLDPEHKGLNYEHSSIYIVYPDAKNPWKYERENTSHYLYRVHEGFSKNSQFASFPHAAERPLFYKDIYGDGLPNIDSKLLDKLERNLKAADLLAISWYNKTFSVYAIDLKENLLKLSVAFESHFAIDESLGKKEALSEVAKIISPKMKGGLDKIIKAISPYVTSMVVRGLSKAVENRTGSKEIGKWFKQHFYSVGSGIRHGDEIEELPKPVISKSKLKKSLWFAGDASHEFLNNVYFGQRLFKFILEEEYFPSNKYLKELGVEQLKNLLVSDEERLKTLERAISNKSVGALVSDDIRITFSFNGTFCGNRERIFRLLKRLLLELKTDTNTWGEIAIPGELLLSANLIEKDFSDYNKTKQFYHAVIDIDGHFHEKETNKTIDDKEMKSFYIKQFISFAVQRLI